MSRTGCRCGSGSSAARGSTSPPPTSRTTALSWTCAAACSSAGWTWRDREGRRTRIVQQRFVSRKDEHLAGLTTEFTAENWSGTLEVSSGLDGRIVNSGVKRYRDLDGRHLTVLGHGEVDADTIDLQVETTQSRVRVAIAARTRLLRDGAVVPAVRGLVEEPGFVAHELAVELEQGRPATVEKVVALYTSRDRAITESRARRAARRRRAPTTTRGCSPGTRAPGAAPGTATTCSSTARTSGPRRSCTCTSSTCCRPSHRTPRTWTSASPPGAGHGEAYRGHIFWDELFIFPFFNLQRPSLAGALLDYRFARLGMARAAARADGLRRGDVPLAERLQRAGGDPEAAPQPEVRALAARPVAPAAPRQHRDRLQRLAALPGHRQHGFLRFTGGELLIEIARFWSSATTYDAEQDRYEIHGVMGPDEYHEGYPDSDEQGLRNNTYTNVMAVWVLQRALQALDELPEHYREEVVDELTIRDEELDRWRDITQKMMVVFHADGVLTQFEGYEQLQEFDWEGYRERYGDIHRLDRLLEAEGDSADRYKVSKQADVLMLLFLLSRNELWTLLAGLGYHGHRGPARAHASTTTWRAPRTARR